MGGGGGGGTLVVSPTPPEEPPAPPTPPEVGIRVAIVSAASDIECRMRCAKLPLSKLRAMGSSQMLHWKVRVSAIGQVLSIILQAARREVWAQQM